MKVTREMIVRCVQEWEIDPSNLKGFSDDPDERGWNGNPDELSYYDQDIIDNGELLREDFIFDLNDDELMLTIDENEPAQRDMAPWIDPDVMMP